MKDLDDKLKSLNMNNIQAPNNLEELLRDSLNKINEKPKTKNLYKSKLLKVAALFLTILVIFNFESVSAFFKDLLGYDNYFSYNSYIKELNEDNMIQTLNEKLVFDNGNEINIEGVLYDGLFINIFAKEPKKTSYTTQINISNASGNERYEDEEGEYIYTVTKFLVSENINSINLNLVNGDFSKNITINLDPSKKLDSNMIYPTSKKITIDKIDFVVDSVRISPLAFVIEYSVTSQNPDKAKQIINYNNDRFGEGISLVAFVEGKNIDMAGVLAYDSTKELPNGVTFKQNIHCKDIRVDKIKSFNIILGSAAFYSKLEYSSPDKLNNKWINDELYIESFSPIDNDPNLIEISYWSKTFKSQGEINLIYQIQPIKRLYTTSKKPSLELLGENYKEFTNTKVLVNKLDFNDNIRDIMIMHNKAYTLSEKDRTITIKVN